MDKDKGFRYKYFARAGNGADYIIEYASFDEKEYILEKERPNGQFVKPYPYKWHELKGEPFFKKFKYMFHISDRKWDIIKILIAAIFGFLLGLIF